MPHLAPRPLALAVVLVGCAAPSAPALEASELSVQGPVALAATGPATPSPHLAIAWPDSETTPVNPRLVYACAEVTCADMAQATQVDYVTAVPVQSQYGVESPAPAPLSFFDPVAAATTFTVFVADDAAVTPATTWTACTLGVTAAGALDPAHTTCVGATLTANATPTVSTFAVATPPFTTGGPVPPPAGYHTYLPVPPQAITFVNSMADDVCLNLESQFTTNGCTGTGDVLIPAGGQHVLSIAGSGSVSGAAFVTGVKQGSGWVYSGRSSAGNVYATAMEWTIFPTAPMGTATLPANTTDHSLGMSDVDVSVVDGFNVGVTLSATTPAVCSSATRINGVVQPATYRLYSGVISQVPVSAAGFEAMCPTGPVYSQTPRTQVETDGSGAFAGCLSPCKFALEVQGDVGLADDQVQAICCDGSTYGDSVACTDAQIPWGTAPGGGFDMVTHDQLPYVTNIKANSTNVYTWQFDDDNGNFACAPGSTFTFEITAN